MNIVTLLSYLAPAVVIGAVLCIAYAALYHLWSGQSLRDLILFIVAAAVGFLIGQTMGFVTQVNLLQIGQLHLIEGTIGAWLLLIGTRAIRLQ